MDEYQTPKNTGKKSGVLRLTLRVWVYSIFSSNFWGVRLSFWTEKLVPGLHHNWNHNNTERRISEHFSHSFLFNCSHLCSLITFPSDRLCQTRYSHHRANFRQLGSTRLWHQGLGCRETHEKLGSYVQTAKPSHCLLSPPPALKGFIRRARIHCC